MQTKLVYNVYKEDNTSIRSYNIFDHLYLTIEELRVMKIETLDKEAFGERLKARLRYCFGSRSECEVLIGGIHNSSKEQRIDIYHQLMMNYPLLLNYVWENI